MDAFLTAVSTSIADRKSQSMEDSFVLKTLDLAASSVADLSRRTVVGLHQVVVHRRDTALWGVTVAKGSQIAALRHAPIAEESFVFPPVLIQQITDKHKEAKDKLILRAATSATTAPKPFTRPVQSLSTGKKHRSSGHVSSPSAKRPKKVSTPKPQRKTEATPPASTKPAKDFNQFR